MTAVGSALADPATTGAGPGLLLVAACAGVLLALGVAHYAGVGKAWADVWVVSPFLVLALAWLGGGGLLMTLAVLVLAEDGSVWTVLGAVLGLASAVAWVIGLVGLFWLPRALRPRWLRERLSAPGHPGGWRPGRRTEGSRRAPRNGPRDPRDDPRPDSPDDPRKDTV